MEHFYRKKGGARELLAEENKDYFQARISFWREVTGKDIIMQISSPSTGAGVRVGGMERTHVTDYQLVLTRKFLTG